MAGVTATMEDCVNKIAEVVTPWRSIIAKEDSVSTSHHMIDEICAAGQVLRSLWKSLSLISWKVIKNWRYYCCQFYRLPLWGYKLV